VLTMVLYTFISLLYKQLLQYTLLRSLTVPSALLTKFAKKFHTYLLASVFIFTKLSTKTLLLWRRRVSFEYQGLLQSTLASFLLLFVNVQVSLQTALKKSSNIQLYVFTSFMTWTCHENGAGATPTFGRRRRGGGAQLYTKFDNDMATWLFQIGAQLGFN